MLPSLLDSIGIHVLPRSFSNSSLHTATCNNSLSARRVSAPNHVGKHINFFRKSITLIKQILY